MTSSDKNLTNFRILSVSANWGVSNRHIVLRVDGMTKQCHASHWEVCITFLTCMVKRVSDGDRVQVE
jgi:hypothetical protein